MVNLKGGWRSVSIRIGRMCRQGLGIFFLRAFHHKTGTWLKKSIPGRENKDMCEAEMLALVFDNLPNSFPYSFQNRKNIPKFDIM